MKTKLLKKVRKRYEIVLHRTIRDPFHWLYDAELPLYELSDNNGKHRSVAYKDFDSVYNILVDWIRKDYGYFKKFDNSKKIWYV